MPVRLFLFAIFFGFSSLTAAQADVGYLYSTPTSSEPVIIHGVAKRTAPVIKNKKAATVPAASNAINSQYAAAGGAAAGGGGGGSGGGGGAGGTASGSGDVKKTDDQRSKNNQQTTNPTVTVAGGFPVGYNGGGGGVSNDNTVIANPKGVNDVPQALLDKLKTGVNISRWFGYRTDSYNTNIINYFTDADFKNLQRLNVKFVRLAVDPKLIYQADSTPNPNVLRQLDQAIQKLDALNIAVIIDIHDTTRFFQLDVPKHDNSGFVKFWAQMATYFKGKYEKAVIFEPVNEPGFIPGNAALAAPDVWYALQNQLVNTIRAIDSERTILAAGVNYGWINQLLDLPVLRQKNLVYTFHFYEPFSFTHQGAPWANDTAMYLKNVPFPFTADLLPSVLAANDPQYADYIIKVQPNSNATYMRMKIKQAVDWGQKNNVPVLLGEFGAYSMTTAADSRARWYAAMQSIIREFNLPAAIWAYDDDVGLGRDAGKNGTTIMDPVVTRSFYGLN